MSAKKDLPAALIHSASFPNIGAPVQCYRTVRARGACLGFVLPGSLMEANPTSGDRSRVKFTRAAVHGLDLPAASVLTSCVVRGLPASPQSPLLTSSMITEVTCRRF